MALHIQQDDYERKGKAVTNFEHTLPAPQSDLARDVLKDPYVFDFLGIADDVRDSAYHIIDYKGATDYAIGMALVRIIEAIVRNQRSVLTVSTILDGEYGLSDVCLSVPSVISTLGVERIVVANLTRKNRKHYHNQLQLLKTR